MIQNLIRRITTTVGIPTLNGPARLARCLQSIREHTRWDRVGRCKLLVCDDGSTEAERDDNRRIICDEYRDLQDVAGLELIQSPGREGIAASWNKLVRHKVSDVCVLLNDDIEVAADWLEVLAYSCAANRCAGMVALNSYVGLTRAQHRASYPESIPDHAVFPRRDYVEAHLLSGGGDLLASSGSAFAFRRDLYDLVGGFDEGRYFCFYEELDFGVALRKEGYEHFICDYPVLYHMGGATNSEPKNLDARVELEKSRAAFKDKWGKAPAELREELRAERRAGSRVPDAQVHLREWNSSLGNVES